MSSTRRRASAASSSAHSWSSRRRTSAFVDAATIVTMQNYLAELGSWVTVVQGAIFVVCVLLFRRGIVGEIGNLLKKSL